MISEDACEEQQSQVTFQSVVKCNFPRIGSRRKDGEGGPQKRSLEVSYFTFL